MWRWPPGSRFVPFQHPAGVPERGLPQAPAQFPPWYLTFQIEQKMFSHSDVQKAVLRGGSISAAPSNAGSLADNDRLARVASWLRNAYLTLATPRQDHNGSSQDRLNPMKHCEYGVMSKMKGAALCTCDVKVPSPRHWSKREARNKLRCSLHTFQTIAVCNWQPPKAMM